MKKVSPRTVNIEVKFLKALFNKAINWGKADTNPTEKVRLFKESKGRMRYLEKKEIRRLLDVSPDYLRPILLTALNTGMRKSEILTLEWQDVDLVRKTIYIREAKGGEAREVPINEALYKTLLQLTNNISGKYVFSNRDGKPYVDLRKGFKAALKQSRNFWVTSPLI